MVILGMKRGREDFVAVVADTSGFSQLDAVGTVLTVGAAVRVRNGGRIALIRDVVEANTGESGNEKNQSSGNQTHTSTLSLEQVVLTLRVGVNTSLEE